MNFTPFGGPFSGTIPGIHQFATTAALVSTAPVANALSTATTALAIAQHTDQTPRYHTSTVNMTHFNQPLTATTIASKFRPDDPPVIESKYNGHLLAATSQQQYTTIPYNQNIDDKKFIAASINYPQSTITSTTAGQIPSQQQDISQDICNAILQQQQVDTKRVLQNPSWQALTPNSTVADYLSHLPASTLPLSLHHFLKYSAENIKKEGQSTIVQTTPTLGLNSLGTTLTIPQHPQQNQLQQQQQQLQNQQSHQQQQQIQQQNQQQNQQQTILTTNTTANTTVVVTQAATTIGPTKPKKKKRKKPPKERKPKPKPGEIRLTTALDGGLLYVCPECQVAYPERGLLEVHMVGHSLERRFICEICNAALKRKDHLTRHKQSHNPERPFICTVCLKAFKRKEQLSLHFVIHSGEKRHICMECGKGFYRKDHLRKHTRSHIARRVKAELSLQNQNGPNPNNILPPQINNVTTTTTTILQQPQLQTQAQQQQNQTQVQQNQQQQQQSNQQQNHQQVQQQHQIHQQSIQQHHGGQQQSNGQHTVQQPQHNQMIS